MLDNYTYSKKEYIKAEIKDRLLLRPGKGMLAFGGNYKTWNEAQKQCQGYDSEVIFERVKQSALSVRDGKACFERDGYLFYEQHTNFPILAILLSIYIETSKLNVLDFGGSLGSMYFQHKDILQRIGKDTKWTVVEQAHFVEFGKQELCDNILNFEYYMKDVEDCNCIIFGSTLQYLENYMEILQEALGKGCEYIIIDKTPVSSAEWISIEQVHEPIYEASYTMRIFDKEELINIVKNMGYELVESWIPEIGTEFRIKDKRCVFESMFFKLRKE